MDKFNAELEVLTNKRAIVSLSLNGAWAGSYRIDANGKSALYERGYNRACQEAAIKGGDVESYRVAQ